ncbi:hypothetical protein ACFVW8_05150 [Streptomyces sp. NPDC058221]|uniref:hypothetical protein n=1 Tax=Streptomyces sp. NPDC058221 TaxID=3346388 RepID=UPI0036E2D2E4
MHQHGGRRRGRDRRPAAGARPVRAARQDASGPRVPAVAGADVVVVGYFSAKEKGFASLMDAAVADVTALGGRVVGRIVQRRGVSGGGAGKMGLPYSSRTLMSYGKVREVAETCARTDADAAVFLTVPAVLTERQRRVLTAVLGCPAVSLAELLAGDGPGG